MADAILARSPRKLDAMARLLGTSAENARRFLVYLIALHDVGKFSAHFQAKSPEAWVASVEPLLGAWSKPPASRHDQDGYDVREAIDLATIMGHATVTWRPNRLPKLWAAITGHHGQPANTADLSVLNAGWSCDAQ